MNFVPPQRSCRDLIRQSAWQLWVLCICTSCWSGLLLCPVQAACINSEADLRSALLSLEDRLVQICSDIVLESTVTIIGPFILSGACAGSLCKISPAPTLATNLFLVQTQNVDLVQFEALNLAGATAPSVNVSRFQRVAFKKVAFTGNVADNGGAIFMNGPSSAVDCSSCSFTNNRAAKGGGGAIYVALLGTVTISGCNFTSNLASLGGGAIYAQGSNVTISIRGSSFLYNGAAKGGAVLLGGSNYDASIVGNTFTGNNVSVQAAIGDFDNTGGAIAAAVMGSLILAGNVFSGNTALRLGGAMSLAGDASICGESRFAENTALGNASTNDVHLASTLATSAVCSGSSATLTSVSCIRCRCTAQKLCDTAATCTTSPLGSNCTCTLPNVTGTGYYCTAAPGTYPGISSALAIIAPSVPTQSNPPPTTVPSSPPPTSQPPTPAPPPPPPTLCGTVCIALAVVGSFLFIGIVVAIVRCVIRLRRRRRQQVPTTVQVPAGNGTGAALVPVGSGGIGGGLAVSGAAGLLGLVERNSEGTEHVSVQEEAIAQSAALLGEVGQSVTGEEAAVPGHGAAGQKMDGDMLVGFGERGAETGNDGEERVRPGQSGHGHAVQRDPGRIATKSKAALEDEGTDGQGEAGSSATVLVKNGAPLLVKDGAPPGIAEEVLGAAAAPQRGEGSSTQNSGANPERCWKYDIFISHAGDDKTFAYRLHEDFKTLNLEAFLDAATLRAGDSADDHILTALKKAPVGLALLSKPFFEKKWPIQELTQIVRQKTLLPVLLNITHEEAEEGLKLSQQANLYASAKWSEFVTTVKRTTCISKPNTSKDDTPFVQQIVYSSVRFMWAYLDGEETNVPTMTKREALEYCDSLRRVERAFLDISARIKERGQSESEEARSLAVDVKAAIRRAFKKA